MNSLLQQAGVQFGNIPVAPWVLLIHQVQDTFFLELLEHNSTVPIAVKRIAGFSATFGAGRRSGKLDCLRQRLDDGTEDIVTVHPAWLAVLSSTTSIPPAVMAEPDKFTLRHQTFPTTSTTWTP